MDVLAGACTEPATDSTKTVRTQAAIQPEDRRRFLDIVSGLFSSIQFRLKARGCGSPQQVRIPLSARSDELRNRCDR